MSQVIKFIKIRPTDTTVDPKYQRDLDEARAKKIASDFRTDLVGVPVISRRANGQLVRIDGQHRLHGAVVSGNDNPTLMEVHDGLTIIEEAELFLRLNGGRSAVGAFDKFKARLVAQEPVALEIVQTLRKLGLRISKANQRKGIAAVQAVESVHRQGRNLEPTARILTSWMDGDGDAYTKPLLKGVSNFLSEFDESVDEASFVERLQGHVPNRIEAKLRRAKDAFELSSLDAACTVFRDIYNERRKQGRLQFSRSQINSHAAE